MDILAADLPRLGFPGGFLSLYENPQAPAEWANLMLAFNENGRVALPSGQRYPTSQLVPEERLPRDRRFDLVVAPLYFQREPLGLLALEMGPHQGIIYEALRGQLSGALQGALLAARNIELYDEAVNARQAAENANELKSLFLSTVSHELRTPLSLIVGTIEIMQQEAQDLALPSEFHLDLRSIHTSAQHLQCLLADVLDLASSQAGELRLVCQPLDLGKVLQEVEVLTEPGAREKGLAWRAEIPQHLPLVWGDRTRLRQVALNLVNNAIKFTQRGEIALNVEVGEKEIAVVVNDTGLGIPLAEQDVIFDEFRQSKRTAQRGFGGMGLGLAISRRLVEMHGGKIGVYSSGEDGAGSTFFFSLPTIPGSENKEETTHARTRTVLLLTERSDGGAPLLDHLARRGFQVEALDINANADWLAQIALAPPAAVVLDLEPDAEQGWELIGALKENPLTQDIPVVFYSLSTEENHGSILELDYLTKPMSGSELEHALERRGLNRDECENDRMILVVDDEPLILDLHVRIVQSHLPGCRVLQTRNGREALELMERQRPDLVLLDLMMPELN